nr:hypothetical protein [Spirosomataceae bacterium]
ATTIDREAALNKLCTLNPTNKDALCQELYGYEVSEINAFLEDLLSKLTNADALGNHVSNMDVALVRAWRKIYEAKSSGYRIDWAALQNYKNLTETEKTNLQGEPSLVEILRSNARQPCNTCQATSTTKNYLNGLAEYILDLKHFSGFSGADGYATAIGLLKSNTLARKLEPETFIIRVLKSENLAATGFEVRKIGCEPDMVLAGNVLCEFKSWRTTLSGNAEEDNVELEDYEFGNTPSYDGSKTPFENFVGGNTGVKQFIAYLSLPDVSDMSKLRYYFDARKGATEAYAKSAFKQMMYNGTDLTSNGAKVFDAVWGNTTLRGNIWNDIPANPDDDDKNSYKGKFKDIVSSTSNSFYNFIKVK